MMIRRKYIFALVFLLPILLYIIFTRIGNTSRTQLAASETKPEPAAEEQKENLEQFQALPYTQWTSKDANAKLAGVTVHDRKRVYPGINLYANDTREVYLVDMMGKRVNAWMLPFRRNAEHARLLENGDLVAISVLKSILRLDWKSRVIWQNDIAAHHDICVLPDGSFLIPLAEPWREFNSYKVTFDSIAHLSESGDVLDQWSSLENLTELNRHHLPSPLDKPMESEIAKAWEEKTRLNYFHMNAVSLLPQSELGKRDSRFRKGNLLVCMRNVNLILILHKDTQRVLWSWGPQDLDGPHHPTMLENGNILIFDNGTKRKFSRVVELDPVRKQIVWEYRSNPPQEFFSSGQGSAQRFPNGNTLICQSDLGRAFEVDANGKIVWEFWNPSIVKGKRHKMYRFIRYALDFLKPETH